VVFHFSKGSLRKTTPEAVEKVIEQTLSEHGSTGSVETAKTSRAVTAPLERKTGNGSSEAPPPPSAAAPAPAPDDDTSMDEVVVGQTPEQVVAILGPPLAIADLHEKIVYKYRNFKVFFVNGKVSEVRPFRSNE
jgi:hypothetical protein